DEEGASKAAAAVFEEFGRIDRLMTTWRDDSAVMRINAAAGQGAVAVDAELLAVFLKAQEVAQASGGAFDITVGAFWGLWKFDEDRDGTVPAAEAVRERLALVGYKNVRVDR